MHFAVPVISGTLAALKHVQVAPAAIERLAAETFKIPVSQPVPQYRNEPSAEAGSTFVPTLECRFNFSGDDDAAIPMLLIGGQAATSAGIKIRGAADEVYFALADGLTGAVAITHAELMAHLPYVSMATFRHYPLDELTSSASFMDAKHHRISYLKSPLHEAIAAALAEPQDLNDALLSMPQGAGHVLKELAFVTRKRSATLRGLEQILSIGSDVDPRDLKMDFAYHCGTQQQSIRKFFDIQSSTAELFLTPLSFRDGRYHGVKALSCYGTAVYVGCSLDDDLGVVSPFWHPVGSAAAQSAPSFQPGLPWSSHSEATDMVHPRVLEVGWSNLEMSGPLASSMLLDAEVLSRYMSPSAGAIDGAEGLDTTAWLNKGLFGRAVGSLCKQPVAFGHDTRTFTTTVAGVRFNQKHNALEQVGVNETTGEHVILP